MNGNNSHFDENFFGKSNTTSQPSSNRTYEYVFSAGMPHTTQATPTKKKKKENRNWLFLLVAVLLCATCSFAAGFGGVLLANYRISSSATDEGVNDAPAKDSLYAADPQSVLDKSQSSPSIYGSAGEEVFSVSQVVQKVEDAVVVIDVIVTTGNSWYGQQTETGAGSGVIISADGYILTCNHVVEGASSITVTLNSGSQYEAALVGTDATSDLAVIRIQPKESEPLTYAEQGCSADLVVGETVVAIGNPLGTLGGTVTDGIISATERRISTSDGTVMTLLQTNAAINSGNSGGGLFNLDGKLIGIVNAKYAAEGVEGLAFAIPIDSAYTVEKDLIQYGYVRGIVDSGLETMDINFENMSWYQQELYKRNYGIDSSGVYVISSSFCAELQNADRILSVDGISVNSVSELKEVISKYKVGDTLTIEASRNKGETVFTASLTLQEYVPDYVTENAG